MNQTLLATVSLVSISISFVLVIALHALIREYNPLTRALSNYSNSRHGWMMFVAFFGFATSQFALAAAFRQMSLPPGQEMGVGLLTASAACVLIAGIFPTDKTPDDSVTSPMGVIHAIAGHLLSPLVVGAMLCLSETWQSWTLAIISAIAFIALLIVNAIPLPVGGIGQRIFIALVSLWLALTSVQLFPID